MSFRSRLRPLKRVSARIIECSWCVGFGAAARLVRRRATRWTSPGKQRVLVIAPHPDDEALGCVGTILLHAQAGDQVCVAIATDGRRSAVIADAQSMALQRRREAEDAARLMQLTRLEWLGFPEGDWSTEALRDSLTSLITEISPDIIYAPSRIDFHPEHWRVANALALALATKPLSEASVRIYQVQVPLTPLISNLVVDVSALATKSAAVLHAYTSQAGSLQCAFRQRHYSARLRGVGRQAEEFWELPASGYVYLHRSPPAEWPSAFRGLRQFPATDPLAFFIGNRERRRLRSLAAAYP